MQDSGLDTFKRDPTATAPLSDADRSANDFQERAEASARQVQELQRLLDAKTLELS